MPAINTAVLRAEVDTTEFSRLSDLRDRYFEASVNGPDTTGDNLLIAAKFFIARSLSADDDYAENSAANIILAYGDFLASKGMIDTIPSTEEVFNE